MSQLDPPILISMWICLSNFREWRKRRKIDEAFITLSRMGEHDVAEQLHKISDRLWDQAFESYTNQPK